MKFLGFIHNWYNSVMVFSKTIHYFGGESGVLANIFESNMSNMRLYNMDGLKLESATIHYRHDSYRTEVPTDFLNINIPVLQWFFTFRKIIIPKRFRFPNRYRTVDLERSQGPRLCKYASLNTSRLFIITLYPTASV